MLRQLLASSLVFASLSAQAEVVITDPYARAVPPGQLNSAAFMTVRNTGSDNLAITSAQSNASNVVELHTHSNDNGVMRMRQIEKIDLPAGKTISLQPGGLHVMLIDLKQDLVAGSQVNLTLNFSDGSSQDLSVPVKKVMPMGKHMHHKMQEHKHQTTE